MRWICFGGWVVGGLGLGRARGRFLGLGFGNGVVEVRWCVGVSGVWQFEFLVVLGPPAFFDISIFLIFAYRSRDFSNNF